MAPDHKNGFVRKIVWPLLRIPFFVYEFWRKFRTSHWKFTFNGEEYVYMATRYNTTWLNERAVEIPIAKKLVDDAVAHGLRVLEVGNVLQHYGDYKHTVVDKYEQAEGVLNTDIVEYSPDEKFDLIVSISTIEHVGWDETPREPGKVLRALEHLRSLMAPGGRMLITFPPGYNSFLDGQLRDGKLKFDEMTTFQKRKWSLHWDPVEISGLNCRPWRGLGGTGELLVGLERF